MHHVMPCYMLVMHAYHNAGLVQKCHRVDPVNGLHWGCATKCYVSCARVKLIQVGTSQFRVDLKSLLFIDEEEPVHIAQRFRS